MSERTPLLRVARPKGSRFPQRLFVYTTVGVLLLGIYQLVFLARTSASRDWDHLHKSEYTTAELQRAIVKGISNDSIAEYADHYFLSGPHLAGQNLELAEWTRQKFEDYGFDAEIETFDIYINYPLDHRVALLNGSHVVHELSLEEDVLKEDPTTGSPDRIPTFHGYSASGNATGKLVYANFGRKRDYETLVDRGVDLKDKIVIVRYGGNFRGLKVKFAEELGAAAVLIYSDPKEDGEITEKNGYKPYPKGPARNPSSVQRGSVQDLSHSPGDPTTPGWPSLPGANRTEPEGIPGIPSIPISYEDALPLLKALNGHGHVFDDWKGGLDGIDYAVGPSKLEVNVYNEQEYKIRAVHNVIATLPGLREEEVIIGNHRDAWVLGASDPNSGSIAVLELARVFGELYRKGWRPYRTLVFASWDGEEYGLLGSTEWGEAHAKSLRKKALAYLNSDVAWTGPVFEAASSPLLFDVINYAAKNVLDPVNNTRTVYETWAEQSDAVIKPLGSGSDYTVFQDHLGIPSFDFGFRGGPTDPVYHYHSNYDSLHWLRTVSDPHLHGHVAAAQFLGLAAVQLTDHAVIPFSLSPYSEQLHHYLTDYLKDEESEQAQELLSVSDDFVTDAANYDDHLDELREDYKRDYPWYKFWHKFWLVTKIKVANYKLLYFERNFIYKKGLDGRPWFKHIVYAPGRYTGYAGQVLPGIAESLEDHTWERLSKWIGITQDKISDALSSLH